MPVFPSSDETKKTSLIFLSLLCFTLADVRDGLGPFLGVFLQEKGWRPDEIGYVMTAGGLAGMLFATPFGALADRTAAKRLLLGVVTTVIVAACGIIFLSTAKPVVWTSMILQGALAAAIAPALTSVTLGLVGQKGLPDRLGKNEAWNHFGNGATALLGGIVGYFYGVPGVFAVMAVTGLLALASLPKIDRKHIDYAAARGLDDKNVGETPSTAVLFRNLGLLAVSVTLFFFHLGNAAMLPLIGQAAVHLYKVDPAVYTAATVLIAQATMVVTALWGAKIARTKGYGPLFVLALAALPIRGGLVAFGFDSAWSLIPVQIRDGVGAGLMGVATPGIVARILHGTGHVNMGLGFVLTIQGIGAALSSSYGGLFAHLISYKAAFLALALAPCLGMAVFVAASRRFPSLNGSAVSAERTDDGSGM